MGTFAIGVALLAQIAHPQTTAPLPGRSTTLYNFAFGSDVTGSTPHGGLTLGDDGNFYGSTSAGGPGRFGTIFQITREGEFKVLYSFRNSVDGAPRANLAKDRDGNLYGTTANTAFFRITPDGAFTSFGRLPGTNANGLLYASDGNFYGITTDGGSQLSGTFFRLSTAGVITLVHTFSGAEGRLVRGPSGALAEGLDGSFYGVGALSVYKITPEGAFTALISVPPNAVVSTIFDGLSTLASGLTLAPDGNFYGVGSDGVFRISPSGTFKRLFRFTEVSLFGNGNSPYHDNRSGLVLGGDGNLYGALGESDNRCFGFCAHFYQINSAGAVRLLYRTPGNGSEGGVSSILTIGPDGLYGTTLNGGTGRPIAGGTVFRLVFAGSGGLGTGTGGGAGPAPGPVEAVDPNTDALRAPFLTWNAGSYDAFARASRKSSGITADGVTPLILRCTVPQPAGEVTFQVTDENGNAAPVAETGALGCVNNPSCGQAGGSSFTAGPQLLADGRTYMAFARLTAPVDFTRLGRRDEALQTRTLTITATIATAPGAPPRASKTTLTLARPPVVLLHGIWSDQATWDWRCVPSTVEAGCLQTDGRFQVWTEDYQATHADPFAVNLGLDAQRGVNHPKQGVQRALELARARGIAATQADFVGHSMGGLLGRIYASDYPGVNYIRDDNFGAGDVHKLITLDSPHQGSELATELLQADGRTASSFGQTVAPLLGCVTCGAAADLRPGSAILSAMPETKAPSHAIVGVGGNRAVTDASALAGLGAPLAPWVTAFVVGLGVFTDAQLQCVFGQARHDLIVSAPSQVGGMTASAVSFFDAEPSVENPSWWAVHFSVTKESRISRRVIELLNAPVSSDWFSQFPAASAATPIGGLCLGN